MASVAVRRILFTFDFDQIESARHYDLKTWCNLGEKKEEYSNMTNSKLLYFEFQIQISSCYVYNIHF